jgi:hypothetical protein
MCSDGFEGLEIFHTFKGAGIYKDPLVHISLGHGLDVQHPVVRLDDNDEREMIFLANSKSR